MVHAVLEKKRLQEEKDQKSYNITVPIKKIEQFEQVPRENEQNNEAWITEGKVLQRTEFDSKNGKVTETVEHQDLTKLSPGRLDISKELVATETDLLKETEDANKNRNTMHQESNNDLFQNSDKKDKFEDNNNITHHDSSELSKTSASERNEEWITEETESENLKMRLRRIIPTQRGISHTNQPSDDGSFDEDTDDSLADPHYNYPPVRSQSSTQSEISSTESDVSFQSNYDAADESNPGDALTERNKTKSRKTNSNEWKKNKASILRNSGKAYISNSATKRPMKERRMGPPCGQKCRLKCFSKIQEEY